MHHNGTENGDPAIRDAACDNKKAPPEQCFSKIVRVTSVAPETCFAELTLLGISVGNVRVELGISDSFEEESNDEHCQAKVVCPL